MTELTRENLIVLKQSSSRGKLKAHTHEPLDDLLQRLNINAFERLLLWLAKTDYYALSLTTFHSRLTLSSLGLMVIFTSLMAFSSAVYALHSMVVAPDISMHWLIVIGLALVYGFGIMIIDREIIGSISTNWQSILIRLCFALFISSVVAFPIKTVLFHDRINVEIKQMVNDRHADKHQELETLKQSSEEARLEQQKNIKSTLAQITKTIDENNASKEEERKLFQTGMKHEDVTGKGKKFWKNSAAKEAVEKKYETMLKPLYSEQTKLQQQLAKLSIPGVIPKHIQSQINKLEENISLEQRNAYDILSKYEALTRIGEKAGIAYTMMSVFVTIFFMSLELVPLFLKLALGKTEYHYYMESRANLTNQKIIGLTNMFIKTIQAHPEYIPDLPPEISDLIAAQIEDEASSFDASETDDLPDAFLGSTNRGATVPEQNPKTDPPTTDEPMPGDK